MQKRRAINSAGLPFGSGSLHKRGQNLWAVYFDADGQRHQENTWTLDPDAAKAYLVIRALRVAHDRVVRLKAILDDLTKAGAVPAGSRVR